MSENTDTDPMLWKMSSFYAAKLLAELHPKVVGVTVSDHDGFAPTGFTPESWTWWAGYDPITKTGPEIPFLTAAATVSPDGSELALLLLNRNTVSGFDISLDLGSFKPNNSYKRIELDSIYPDQGHEDIFDENSHGTNAIEQVVLQESENTYDGTIHIWPHQAVVVKFSKQVSDTNLIYLSSTSGGIVGGVSFADEDILEYDTGNNTWSMYFDGSDVGLGGSGKRDIDAFYLMTDGSILLSTKGNTTLPDLGDIRDSDIVRFVPETLGTDTSGYFEMYFDGSDVGLSSSREDIDAIGFAHDGRLLISTAANFNVPGVSGNDEDIIAFSQTGIGANTSGTWSMYFDGSDVGLSNSSDEDLWGTWIDRASDKIYLTTRWSFNVSGVSGDGTDIFICNPSSLGARTSCTFSSYWNGSAKGYSGERIDGFAIKK